MSFEDFPKIPRLSRTMIITEKIDGTNAQIFIETLGVRPDEPQVGSWPFTIAKVVPGIGTTFIYAGSRTRWVTPGKDKDNHGFAGWVRDHAEELFNLGEGRHFGEWWGQGIQRGYNLKEKRFSLFNTGRWTSRFNDGDTMNPDTRCIEVPVCHVVPVLWAGEFTTERIEIELMRLKEEGSKASPGFDRPEGVVIFHEAGGYLFKKTLENDNSPKSLVK